MAAQRRLRKQDEGVEWRKMAAMEHVRNIAVDLILSVVTCGLYNLYWQYKQIDAVNDILKQEKYSFISWLLLCLVTCGLYHIYHEYRMSTDLAEAAGRPASNDGLIAIVLTIFGLAIVVDAIQQSQINNHYGDSSL